MITGGCYCGAVRYEIDGEPSMRGQCHCRECQYITGGGPNFFMMLPAEGFRYAAGEPKSFTRPDLPNPVTREFCATCGTHLATRLSFNPNVVILKVGGLDDLASYAPQIAIWTDDMPPFHVIADGVTTFPKFPG